MSTTTRTVEYMIEHAKRLQGQDPEGYRQLVYSMRGMSEGGHGGQPEPWSLYTVRSEYYPGWKDTDFGRVLDALGETVDHVDEL